MNRLGLATGLTKCVSPCLGMGTEHLMRRIAFPKRDVRRALFEHVRLQRMTVSSLCEFVCLGIRWTRVRSRRVRYEAFPI